MSTPTITPHSGAGRGFEGGSVGAMIPLLGESSPPGRAFHRGRADGNRSVACGGGHARLSPLHPCCPLQGLGRAGHRARPLAPASLIPAFARGLAWQAVPGAGLRSNAPKCAVSLAGHCPRGAPVAPPPPHPRVRLAECLGRPAPPRQEGAVFRVTALDFRERFGVQKPCSFSIFDGAGAATPHGAVIFSGLPLLALRFTPQQHRPARHRLTRAP